MPFASPVLLLGLLVCFSPTRASGQRAPAQQEQADAAPKSVDALMERLRKMPGLHARFEERKTIALLAAPLVNRGTVRFHPPGSLLRTVDEPNPSSVLLRGKDIWLRERNTVEHIDLHAHPAARSFVGSFRALLAGDRDALDAHFVLSLAMGEDERSWTLELRPRTEAMQNIVTLMSIEGHGHTLRRLRIEEATGDVSDTRFFDVDTAHRHSDDDVQRYFSPPER